VSSGDGIRLPRIGPEIAGRLKIWPGDLDEIVQGKKRSDVRRCDDRQFRVGQVWELSPWDPNAMDWIVLPSVMVRITHVERMAGPLMLCGVSRKGLSAVPMAVLSFEIV
jgi:hypothetical protein